MSYIKWLTESQTARFSKGQNKPINLYEWQGQNQWRRWQSIIRSVKSVTFYSQGCFHSQCVFKYRAWNLIIIRRPQSLSQSTSSSCAPQNIESALFYRDFLSGQWVIGPKIHPNSNSGWFLAMIWTRMIYELRGTIQPLVYFGKVIIRPPQKKLFVISFAFLSNLQVPQFENIESANVNQGVLDQNFW